MSSAQRQQKSIGDQIGQNEIELDAEKALTADSDEIGISPNNNEAPYHLVVMSVTTAAFVGGDATTDFGKIDEVDFEVPDEASIDELVEMREEIVE